MDDNSIYFIKLAAWLSRALGEGSSFLSEMDTDVFGIRLPEALILNSNVQGAAQAVSSAGTELAESANELETVVASGDEAQVIRALAKVAENLAKLFPALDHFVSEFSGQMNPVNMPDADEQSVAKGFAAHLAKRIIDYLVINVIESNQPQLALILKTIGLIEWERVPAEPENLLSIEHFKKSLNFHFFKDFISNPVQHLIDTIGWGSNDFNPADLFYTIKSFYRAEDSIEVGTIDGDAYLERGIFRLKRDSTKSPPGLAIELIASLNREIHNRIKLNDNWGIGVDTDVQFTGGIAAKFYPPFSLTITPQEGEVKGIFRLFLNRNEEARPFSIIGGNSLLQLSAEDTSIGLGLTATADAIGRTVEVDPLIFSEIKALTLRLGSSEGDGFLDKILEGAEIEGQFDLGLEWTGSKGLVIKASGGIEILIPLHKTVGFIEIESALIGLRIKPDAVLELEVSAIFSASLGPLNAVVERMGITSQLKMTDGSDLKYGFFDLSLGFKPPNGVGLSIDAGVVKGGGYLSFDFDREEYAGALELTFANFLALKAIGLVTTKLPDGSKGFSLLIIITVEFGTGLQLGFGFTLLGVGGLLGLNRASNSEALLAGIRAGSVANIMFPRDVVANAPRIISDLRAFFPAEEGKFLIGPMAKLGWGTPTLVSVSLGVIVEFSTQGSFSVESLTILGVLKVALPTEEAAVLQLQVQFLGRIEFDKRRAYFFASLFDSRILFMTIEGEMGMLIDWSDNPNFVLSVGGFHPRFSPPPLPFPAPRRITVELSNNPFYRVRVEGYFAVTSNTAQFGAQAELEFKIGDVFQINGHIAFDALFQFSPFYFIIEISASVSLRVFGTGVFSIRLEFALSGPTPWRARGSGYISLLFFEFAADFDVTWGESADTTLEPVAILPLLSSELKKEQNWTARLPEGSSIQVSLRKLEGAQDTLVFHPLGTLLVTQRLVPLALTLDKLGNQKPSDFKKFDITLEGNSLQPTQADEQFALAQFKNMSDAEKLSQAAFQPLQGGLVLSDADNGGYQTGRAVKRVVRYETIVIDTRYRRFQRRFFEWSGTLFTHFFVGGAITKSPLSQHQQKQLQPFADKIEVLGSDLYTVAAMIDNTPFVAEASSFSSEASAREYLQTQVRNNPALRDTLHVIPQYEANL